MLLIPVLCLSVLPLLRGERVFDQAPGYGKWDETAAAIRAGRHDDNYQTNIDMNAEGSSVAKEAIADANLVAVFINVHRVSQNTSGCGWDFSVDQILFWSKDSEAVRSRDVRMMLQGTDKKRPVTITVLMSVDITNIRIKRIIDILGEDDACNLGQRTGRFQLNIPSDRQLTKDDRMSLRELEFADFRAMDDDLLLPTRGRLVRRHRAMKRSKSEPKRSAGSSSALEVNVSALTGPPGKFKMPTFEATARLIPDRAVPQIEYDSQTEHVRSAQCFGAGSGFQVQDQGKCSNCFTMSSTSVAADRACLAGLTNSWILPSAQHYVSCHHKDVDDVPIGCRGGGTAAGVWARMKTGLVTAAELPFKMACWRDETEIPSETKVVEVESDDECPHGRPVGIPDTEKCPVLDSTATVKVLNTYQLQLWRTSDSLASHLRSMQIAILEGGSIDAGFRVFEDFQIFFRMYPLGVYRHDSVSRGTGRHAVVVSGWGAMPQHGETLDYWLCRNSWGANFADHGKFRIQRGVNMVGIEGQPLYVAVDHEYASAPAPVSTRPAGRPDMKAEVVFTDAENKELAYNTGGDFFPIALTFFFECVAVQLAPVAAKPVLFGRACSSPKLEYSIDGVDWKPCEDSCSMTSSIDNKLAVFLGIDQSSAKFLFRISEKQNVGFPLTHPDYRYPLPVPVQAPVARFAQPFEVRTMPSTKIRKMGQASKPWIYIDVLCSRRCRLERIQLMNRDGGEIKTVTFTDEIFSTMWPISAAVVDTLKTLLKGHRDILVKVTAVDLSSGERRLAEATYVLGNEFGKVQLQCDVARRKIRLYEEKVVEFDLPVQAAGAKLDLNCASKAGPLPVDGVCSFQCDEKGDWQMGQCTCKESNMCPMIKAPSKFTGFDIEFTLPRQADSINFECSHFGDYAGACGFVCDAAAGTWSRGECNCRQAGVCMPIDYKVRMGLPTVPVFGLVKSSSGVQTVTCESADAQYTGHCSFSCDGTAGEWSLVNEDCRCREIGVCIADAYPVRFGSVVPEFQLIRSTGGKQTIQCVDAHRDYTGQCSFSCNPDDGKWKFLSKECNCREAGICPSQAFKIKFDDDLKFQLAKAAGGIQTVQCGLANAAYGGSCSFRCDASSGKWGWIEEECKCKEPNFCGALQFNIGLASPVMLPKIKGPVPHEVLCNSVDKGFTGTCEFFCDGTEWSFTEDKYRCKKR